MTYPNRGRTHMRAFDPISLFHDHTDMIPEFTSPFSSPPPWNNFDEAVEDLMISSRMIFSTVISLINDARPHNL